MSEYTTIPLDRAESLAKNLAAEMERVRAGFQRAWDERNEARDRIALALSIIDDGADIASVRRVLGEPT